MAWMHTWPTKYPPGSVNKELYCDIYFSIFRMASKNSHMSNSSWLLFQALLHVWYPCLYFQTSLHIFRSKAFTVRRRYSDFLGLYEKLSVKQSLQGCIIPPPPEKSVVGGCSWLFCLFVFEFVCLRVSGFNRNDQSEGWNGRPIIGRICGEKKSRSREARIHTSFIYSYIIMA